MKGAFIEAPRKTAAPMKTKAAIEVPGHAHDQASPVTAPSPAPSATAGVRVPPQPPTREAVWEFAGPQRDAAGLSHLADDPYPLARAIGITGLAREESRGGHRRTDFRETDPGLDFTHLIYRPDGEIELRHWD